MNEGTTSRSWGAGSWTLYVILPLILGAFLSLLVMRPAIGVINLDDAIYSTSAQDLIAQINYAREHREIRAVVLIMNSPGGTVVDTESVYMELARLRKTKPVVTLVEGMAASGGYYLAAGTDYILAKPSSEVGNIGVIGYLPSTPGIYEEIYSTGPYKLWGEPRDQFVREMEPMRRAFLQAVKNGRGDALKLTDEEISRGQIFPGSQALQIGLIDALGAKSQALDQAARMARISHYTIEDLRTLAGLPPVSAGYFYMETEEGVLTPYPKRAGLYYLYIPPTEEAQP